MAPLTGFETTGGTWTTLADEQVFLQSVVALGERVKLVDGGVNIKGRLLQSVVVTKKSSTPDHKKPTLLFVAQQHGKECAGREALLQLIRSWATTDDPAMVEYLENAKIVCIPTANPDGLPGVDIEAGSYYNGSEINVNRDAMNLASPEGKHIQTCYGAHNTVFVVDSHELGGTVGTVFEFMGCEHVQHSRAIVAITAKLLPALISEASNYPGWTGRPFTAATLNQHTLVTVAGYRNTPAVLFETAGLDPTPRLDRVEQQVRAFNVVVQFHRNNLDEISGACASAKAVGLLRATNNDTPFRWGGTESRKTPMRYFVTTAQRSTYAEQFSVFGFDETPTDGGVIDDARGNFPLCQMMMDARAEFNVFDAVPLEQETLVDSAYGPKQPSPAGPLTRSALMYVDGRFVPVRAKVRVDGSWQ